MKALSVCGERQDTHSSVCDLSREIVCLSLYLWLCLHLQIAFIFIFYFDLWSCLLLGLSVKRTSLDPFQYILCCYGWALICREVMNMYLILVDSFLWYMASWDYSLLWGPGEHVRGLSKRTSWRHRARNTWRHPPDLAARQRSSAG